MKVFTKINMRVKISILILACCLITVMVGTTAALFHTTTVQADNGFRELYVNIGVIENDNQDQILENDNTVNFPVIMSGTAVNKKVAIKNIKNDNYPTAVTYVRVRLVPLFRYDSDAPEHQNQLVPLNLDGKVSYEYDNPDNLWKCTGSGNEIYYYYTKKLEMNDQTSNLIKSVTYNGEIPANAHFELQVLAEGIASDQEGSLFVWFGGSTNDYNNGFESNEIKNVLQTINTK